MATKRHGTIGSDKVRRGDRAPEPIVPAALDRTIDLATLRQAQGRGTGVNAVIGRWPGDESDEEIAAALRELS